MENGVFTNAAIRFVDTHGSNWLDNVPFFNGLNQVVASNIDSSVASDFDGPYIDCVGMTYLNETFTNYILFAPDFSGSIYVTLGFMTWKATGTSNISTNGGIADYTPPRTDSITNTEFQPSGTLQISPTMTPSEAFPIWTGVVLNGQANY